MSHEEWEQIEDFWFSVEVHNQLVELVIQSDEINSLAELSTQQQTSAMSCLIAMEAAADSLEQSGVDDVELEKMRFQLNITKELHALTLNIENVTLH